MDPLVLLKGGIELAGAIKRLLPEREKREKRLQDRIRRALRAIYFIPTGVVSLLRDVSDGKKISDERLQRILSNFNDGQWRVEGAVRQIDFQELGHELGVSLSTMRALTDLQYGKMNLRQEIQAEVNRYGQVGARPNKTKIRKLIAAVEELNRTIEAIESVVADKPTINLSSTQMQTERVPRKTAKRAKARKASEAGASPKNKNGRISRSGRYSNSYSAKPTPRDAT